jgi:Fe-S-cluster containining protein
MCSTELPRFGLRCSACPACCKTVRVPLTHFDLGRLVAATSLGATEHIEWLSPQDIDMDGEPETFVEVREGRRLLVLRFEQGACRYLSAEGLCRVYEHRPMSCAAYPYSVSDQDGQRLLMRLADAPCVIATSQLHPSDAAGALAAAACVEDELRQYVVKITEFNRKQRRRRFARLGLLPAKEFLAFLGF